MSSNVRAYAEVLMDFLHEKSFDYQNSIKQLKTINSYIDEELWKVLKHPHIDKNAKKEIFKTAFISYDINILGLIYVLIDNGVIMLFPEIIKEYENMYNQEIGLIIVDVISTQKLKSNEQQKIRQFLEKKLNCQVELKETIDSSLINGIIIKYQNNIIDASLLHKQDDLKSYLEK